MALPPLRLASPSLLLKRGLDVAAALVGLVLTLRTTSLDELPQLANVLRGEISLVGPRPVTRDELSRYGDDVDALFRLKPGLTGYWQINGRSELAYDERVRLDLAYVGGWSLGLDVTLVAKTIGVLLSRRGAA